MSSTKAKVSLTKASLKNEMRETRKKGVISKDDEENAMSSNAITPYRGYNLRSYAPSKTEQLTSKGGNPVNTGYELLKNENPSKFKRKDKIIDKLTSKNVRSPIRNKNDMNLLSKKSLKMEKNVIAKSQIPKCLPLPEPEAKNTGIKSKETSFDTTNTLAPYRRDLKRAPVSNSPMKNPNLTYTDEKDIIKERIFGPTGFRQKKVQFKTISCYNLICEKIDSKELEEAVNSVLNEQESFKEKSLDDKTNNSEENIENFKIFSDLKTAGTSLENETSQENNVVENSEILQTDTRHEDQEDKKCDFMKEDTLNFDKDRHPDNKSIFIKDMNVILPFSPPKTHNQNHLNDEQTKSNDFLKNEVEERLKNLTAHFLEEITQERSSKKKRRPKRSIRNGRSQVHNGCNVLQAASGAEKKTFVQSSQEKVKYLLNSLNPSNAAELNTSPKVFTFQQNPKIDLNLSNFRSPKISKIPRLMQNSDNILSPLWEIDCTPIKSKEVIYDEVSQNQRYITSSYNSQYEVNKTEDLNKTLLIAENIEPFKGQEIDNLLDSTTTDSSETSFDTCFDQKESIMLEKYEILPDTDVNNRSSENEDEIKLVNNIGASLTPKNNNLKEKKESLITSDNFKKLSGEQRKVKFECYTENQSLKKEIYGQNKMERRYSIENKRKMTGQNPVLKKKTSNTKYAFFTIACFVAMFYILLLKILEYPSCDT